ncbi:hypothetical protein Tco_1273529 [Tanacetum coccineum]
MVPGPSKAGVIPKFDMHVYVSSMTSKDLTTIIKKYRIPADRHPRLPDDGFTMNNLPDTAIGIYVEQLEQGHWFSFESRTGRRAKKCFREITWSLKGWKNKIFLIDRKAIPKGMAWRHRDSDVSDDFPLNYNEAHADLVAKITILLRKPPVSIMYMAGLTTEYRHPDRSQILRDAEGMEITMDDFLCLPDWTGTVVSKGDPIPKDQRPPDRTAMPLAPEVAIPEKSSHQKKVEKADQRIINAREKKDKQVAEKAKRNDDRMETAPKKKRKKNSDIRRLRYVSNK